MEEARFLPKWSAAHLSKTCYFTSLAPFFYFTAGETLSDAATRLRDLVIKPHAYAVEVHRASGKEPVSNSNCLKIHMCSVKRGSRSCKKVTAGLRNGSKHVSVTLMLRFDPDSLTLQKKLRGCARCARLIRHSSCTTYCLGS